MIKNTDASRLAVTGLGAATLVTALVVWASDSGLGIVPFRGAVNNTTAGIGFQGYLIWAAAAAIVAPLTLRNALSRKPIDTAAWREALRFCLLLIGVWSVGQIAVRIVYLALAAAGDVSLAAGITATLIGINVAIAALALWVRVVLKSSAVTTMIVVLFGVLFALTDARVAAEIILTASHITATFHVVLCILALLVAAAALRLRQIEAIAEIGRRSRPARDRRAARSSAPRRNERRSATRGQTSAAAPAIRRRSAPGELPDSRRQIAPNLNSATESTPIPRKKTLTTSAAIATSAPPCPVRLI